MTKESEWRWGWASFIDFATDPDWEVGLDWAPMVGPEHEARVHIGAVRANPNTWTIILDEPDLLIARTNHETFWIAAKIGGTR